MEKIITLIGGPRDGDRVSILVHPDEEIREIRVPRLVSQIFPEHQERIEDDSYTLRVMFTCTGPVDYWAHRSLSDKQANELLIAGYRKPKEPESISAEFEAGADVAEGEMVALSGGKVIPTSKHKHNDYREIND